MRHFATAFVQEHSFPRVRNRADDHPYILGAHLLEQLRHASFLQTCPQLSRSCPRRWIKQTFAASCSNDEMNTVVTRRVSVSPAQSMYVITSKAFRSSSLFVVIIGHPQVVLQVPDHPLYVHFKLLSWLTRELRSYPKMAGSYSSAFATKSRSPARVWRITGPAHRLQKLPDDVLVSMTLILC